MQAFPLINFIYYCIIYRYVEIDKMTTFADVYVKFRAHMKHKNGKKADMGCL
jgi:hypothetical protein